MKSECISHIEKRMGTRLRNIKKANKLDGKGELNEKLIKQFTSYYGLAIRRNVNSVENMKKAIMAIYHMYSTNKNSRHEDCPPGADSWQKSQAIGESTNFNPVPLHPDVQKHIQYTKIYPRFQRCLGSHTQNESFNSTA